MNLTWFSANADALAAGLVAAGVPRSGSEFAVGRGVCLRVEAAARASGERLVTDAPPDTSRAATLGVPALGWATVDALRLAADAAWTLEPLPGDDLLGAFAWRVANVRPATVLLEPATEGPIAGALARHGEGPIAIYAADPTPDATAASRATPFGPGRLGLPSRWGPFLVVVSATPPRVPSAA